jgi:hypothetical protein
MTQNPTIGDMMAAYAEDAVDFVRTNLQAELDYSEQSIEVIEAVLGALHDQMPADLRAQCSEDAPPPPVIDQFAKAFGGYIGEVMRRHWGGRWKDQSNAYPGELHYTLELKAGGDVWPHYKAGKRLINGPEDNVWDYFQYLKEKSAGA